MDAALALLHSSLHLDGSHLNARRGFRRWCSNTLSKIVACWSLSLSTLTCQVVAIQTCA